MNRKVGTALIALSLAGGVAACDNQRDAATTPNNENAMARRDDNAAVRNNDNDTKLTEPNRTTQGMSGSELENAVKQKLQSDEQLRAASIDVSADAEKNAVTLSGTVPSQEARQKALELARSAHSGITINDQMEVKPVG
jgi:osmotically-inducible protein OsmY